MRCWEPFLDRFTTFVYLVVRVYLVVPVVPARLRTILFIMLPTNGYLAYTMYLIYNYHAKALQQSLQYQQ